MDGDNSNPKGQELLKKEPNQDVIETLKEIKEWEENITKAGYLSIVLEKLSIPIQWIFSQADKVSGEVITGSIKGMLEMLANASDYTYSTNDIINNVINNGATPPINDIKELKNIELLHLKNSANSYTNSNNTIAAIEGFSCGLGGVALIAADVPLLFGIAFRVIHQIGATFGYDMMSVHEKIFTMQIIDISSTVPTAEKVSVMLNKQILQNFVTRIDAELVEYLIKNPTAAYKIGDAIFNVGAVEKTLRKVLPSSWFSKTVQAQALGNALEKEASKHAANASIVMKIRDFGNKIGINLSQRKIAQLIPLFGGAVGAGFNYWFISRVSEAAFYAYLKRHICDTYNI